ncbi:MAG: DUF4845 domain-containing protein [Gallionella sp.]|nr:DUF4845 domain-containing protein [Gallionella sp.]
MQTAMPATQRGLSFSGFLVGAVILVLVSILGMKLIPVYMEDKTVKSMLVEIANDPDMQKANPRDIKMSFVKRASIDNVKVLSADDIEISKEGDTLVLSAEYAVKIALVGNVSLYLEFNPSSAP